MSRAIAAHDVSVVVSVTIVADAAQDAVHHCHLFRMWSWTLVALEGPFPAAGCPGRRLTHLVPPRRDLVNRWWPLAPDRGA
jgi:hypothetical protein